MGNAFKIVPAIDLINGECVRLRQGDYDQKTIYETDPAVVAERFERAGAAMIHAVDLDGAKAGCAVNTQAVRAIVNAVKIPVEVGGGIRTMDDADAFFDCGVKCLILGTVAVRDPVFAEQMLQRFGSRRIVLGIDARNGFVSVSGWCETEKISAVKLAQDFVAKGFKRIIFTDIATDGMMQGPNFDALKLMANAVPEAEICASGGICSADDIVRLHKMNVPNIIGAIVGRAVYEKPIVLPEMIHAANEIIL